MSKKQNNTDLIYNNKVDKMIKNMVKIEKPESCRGCPVSDHKNTLLGGVPMTDSILTKICSKCQEIKLLDEFGKCKSNANGLSCWCKECDHAKGKAYYNANKDKIKGLCKFSSFSMHSFDRIND